MTGRDRPCPDTHRRAPRRGAGCVAVAQVDIEDGDGAGRSIIHTMPSVPPITPDLNLDTAYREVARLRAALTARDWAGVSDEFARVDQDGASLLVRAAGEEPHAYGFLSAEAARDPADPLAATLLASWLIRAGWQIRTAHRASAVDPEQFAVFHDYLRRAEELLVDVTDRDPGNLAGWELRLLTAQGLELELDEARARYQQAVRHSPHHMPVQAQLLQQLCPKWGGSFPQAHAFARECAAAAPEGASNGVLVAVVHLEHWIELGRGAGRRYLADPQVRQELRDAAARSVWHPQYRRRFGWVGVHSTFAMAFSLAGDRPAAASQFAAIGHLADPFPWGYLGDPATAFHKYRARSAPAPAPAAGTVPASPDVDSLAAHRPGDDPQGTAGLPEHPAVVLAREGLARMPLRVGMRAMRYGWRVSLPLLAVCAAIFVPLGAWLAATGSGLAALVAFSLIPLVLAPPYALFMALRARGPVLAADSDGVWLRPEANRSRSTWLPWYGVKSVYVRRYFWMRWLCVKPRNPAHEEPFLVDPTGNRETKLARQIVRARRAGRLGTNLFVPLTHTDHSEREVLDRLGELGAEVAE